MNTIYAAITLIISLFAIYVFDILIGVAFDPIRTVTFLTLYWVLVDYYDRREHDRKTSRRS